MIHRSILRVVVLAALALTFGGIGTRPAWSQRGQLPAVQASSRVVSLGRLIRSGKARNGTPRFALMDGEGNLTAYVVPAAGLSLGSYVNQEVAVTARQSTRGGDTLPYLLADRVTPMSQHRSAPDAGLDAGMMEANGAVMPVEAINEPQILPDHAVADPLIDAGLVDLPIGSSLRSVGHPAHWDERVRPVAGEEPLPEPAATDLIQPGQSMHSHAYMDEYVGAPGVTGPGCATGQCGDPNCSSCGAVAADCGSCGNNCCPCGPSGRFWLRAEYLMWWAKGMNTPPLVTSSTPNTLAQNAGVLDLNTTSILYGGDEILTDMRQGGRFRLGTWLDPCQWKGIEVDYYFLSEESEDFTQSSNGSPILARPFFNTQLVAQDSELVAFPGIVSGTIGVAASSELMSVSPRLRMNILCQNFSCNSAYNMCDSCSPMPYLAGGHRVDFTIGYRRMQLEEMLRIREQLNTTSNGAASTFDLTDQFDTQNTFDGAELGLVWECFRDRWSWEFAGRFALGNNQREVAINGSTVSTAGGQTFTETGGLYALRSNIGTYTDNDFTVIPEMGVNLGYQLAPSLRFLVGYTFLFWGNVARPGDQIDPRINPNLLPPALAANGLALPEYRLVESNFWAHGLSLGLDWRW